jgi:lipopolysaccharide export system permease protein
MQFLWKYVDDLMGKGLEWSILFELMLYASANLVPLALPLAILLASIMSMGKLAENYELVAMKAAGLSLLRIMFPLTAFAVFLSLLAFLFSNFVAPPATLKFRTLLYSVTKQKPALELKENVFYNGIEGYSIRIAGKDANTGLLENVIIYDHTEQNGGGNRWVIKAKSGKMLSTNGGAGLSLELYDGIDYEELERSTRDQDASFPLRSSRFEKQVINFDLSGFKFEKSDESLFKNGYQMLNSVQLLYAADSMQERIIERENVFLDFIKRNSIATKVDTGKNVEQVFDSSYQKLLRSQLINGIDGAENLVRNAKAYAQRCQFETDMRSKQVLRYEIEWHRKLTLSIACLVLYFIGAPLGAIIKKGGLGLPVVFSVLFFVVFHILSSTGEKMVVAGKLDTFTGVWLATMVLTPVSLFLTYKANADSALFDRSSYIKLFNKIWNRKNN